MAKTPLALGPLSLIDEADVPFELSVTRPTARIEILVAPSDEAIAAGETEPIEWIDFADIPSAFDRLFDVDAVALDAGGVELVVDFPFEAVATRRLSRGATGVFSRKTLLLALIDTYQEIDAMDSGLRRNLAPRAPLSALGLTSFEVFERAGQVWLNPEMES